MLKEILNVFYVDVCELISTGKNIAKFEHKLAWIGAFAEILKKSLKFFFYVDVCEVITGKNIAKF